MAAGIEWIIEDTRLLTDVLDDLLVAADPRKTADDTMVDLHKTADRAVCFAMVDAQSRTIGLQLTGSAETLTVLGSEVSLQRIFAALISNALDHARTAITVDVARRGRDVVIRVCDDGPGFSTDEVRPRRAFDRFASSRSPEGAVAGPRHYGLDLALVAEITARHHGSVSIAPPTRAGVVVVTLPLAPS